MWHILQMPQICVNFLLQMAWHKKSNLVLELDAFQLSLCIRWFHHHYDQSFQVAMSLHVFLLTHWALDHIKMWSGTIILIRFSKNSELCTKRKRKIYFKKWALICQLNVAMALRNYFRRNYLWILKLATYTKIEDHYFRCKSANF